MIEEIFSIHPFGRMSIGGNASAVIYLIRDDFTTALAAGAVNGSPNVPGGTLTSTRVLIDSGSKVSIAGGEIVWTSGVGNVDPAMRESGAITRASGRVFLAQVKVTSIQVQVGWNNSTTVSLANRRGVLDFANSELYVIWNNGGSATLIGAYVIGTTYQMATVLLATGNMIFVKGGIYTSWSLLWIDRTDTGATVYAAFYNIGSGSNVALDNFHVPDPLFLPSPLAYDTFTRANGALGNSETTGPDGQVVTARAWTLQNGTIAIVSNTASLTVLGGLTAYATVNAGSADVMIDVAVTRTLGSGGIILRYVDANNYIIAYHNGTNCRIDKVVAGSTTNVVTANPTYSAGAVVRVVCYGTKFRLFYAGAAVGSEGTIADAALQTSALFGLYGSDLSAVWDNFTVWSRGLDNAYSTLDSYLS